MDEVNSMCEQMGDISKEMGALRGKKWNYILTDLVGCLGPLITWICVRKDCKLEAISKEISESPKGMDGVQDLEKEPNIWELNNYRRCNILTACGKETREKGKEIMNQ